ncbi:unnamed protein product [Owenia fusiformis]|uniref:Chitin-binding type-2 domain-containing protein n=1 Tax=Owenia fusiformis TaxID=6347 RepID=A0A8S4MV58_OWEFU|nr:unnamed protein product [Owenia fusiformis]
MSFSMNRSLLASSFELKNNKDNQLIRVQDPLTTVGLNHTSFDIRLNTAILDCHLVKSQILGTAKMLKLLLLCCFYAVSMAIEDNQPMITAIDVDDPDRCKTGYFNEQSDDCCHYYQCDFSGRKAFRRMCMEPLVWNDDIGGCAFNSVPDTCDDSVTQCYDPVPTPKPCDTEGDPDKCCERGITWDDHTTGTGNIYTINPERPDIYQVCNKNHKCPRSSFNVTSCSCNPVETNCDCMYWSFSAPAPFADKNQGVPFTRGSCRADVDNSGTLVCDGESPAELKYMQLAYFDYGFTMFASFAPDLNGVVTTNEGINGPSVEATVSGDTVTVTVGEVSLSTAYSGSSGSKWFVFTKETSSKTVSLYVGDSSSFSKTETLLPANYNPKGNRCTLKLGLTASTYDSFGLCTYGWTEEDVSSFQSSGEPIANPNPVVI